MKSSISSYNIGRRARTGQTLVIAIMVMFIVALVAAVFIGLVARNLTRSERFSNIDAVSQIAEAGVRYADQMLTSSEDGADWRPVPDNIGSTIPNDVPPFPLPEPQPVDEWPNMRDKYPDFRWTRAYWPTELPENSAEGMGYAGPTGGYTSFDTGQGRFLLRVSYNPNMSDPLSKNIKIESIGRWGVFDENDPTTYKPYGDVNMRREITAYKPIGVTDYARFITNKDNRSTDFALGCPGFQTRFGRSASGSDFGPRGAPIRVNGNLTWYGDGADAVEIYLRGAKDTIGNLTPIDRVEIAGKVSVADDTVGVQLARLHIDGSVSSALTPTWTSDDTRSTWTIGGFYRDSSPETGGAERRIKRIEPPLVDQPDITNTTTRYRLLTLSSGERMQINGQWKNLGEFGWGRGIYIGNSNDVQSDSETLIGGYSVRSDWMKPNNPISSYWKGPYYIPPGVVITLHPENLEITRTDTGFTSWYDAWGNPRPEWGRTVVMPYPNPSGDPAVNGRTITNPDDNTITKTLDGNGVIYAEGNIRIRGMLPSHMQLTVVSGQNIYIEGNLLKNRDSSWENTSTDAYRGADPTCGLALMAEQNICVNTTMFFAPLNGIGSDSVGSDSQNGQPPYHIIVSSEPDSRPRVKFDLGPWESESGAATSEWFLLLRHSGQYGTSYINAWLNPGYSDDMGARYPNGGLLGLNTGWTFGGFTHTLPTNGVLPPYVWGIGDPNFNEPGWGIGSAFAGEVFPLTTDINANIVKSIGKPNLLQIALDQSSFTRNNYLLGGLAVQPMDVRIEAVMYAQEGSFYVIPGNWFNPNPSDIASNDRPLGVRQMFPYFGQPLDIKVTIDGAVSENVPAPISDVEEWMSKWGKIPDKYGNSGVDTAHPGEGLTFLYDDHAGWPLYDEGTTKNIPIRTDKYGRMLPIAPRLPVSGSLIYFGDVM